VALANRIELKRLNREENVTRAVNRVNEKVPMALASKA
jgi:hypothetical protein